MLDPFGACLSFDRAMVEHLVRRKQENHKKRGPDAESVGTAAFLIRLRKQRLILPRLWGAAVSQAVDFYSIIGLSYRR